MQIFEAVVTALAPPYIQVSYVWQNGLRDRICRPVMCGATSGLHWMPQQGDKVALVLIQGGFPLALCGLADYSAAQIAAMPTLLGGETALLGPTGNLLKVVQTGAIEAGNPTNAFKPVALNGDAIAGSITAPSGGGACSFSLTVSASAAVLKGN